MLKLIKKILNKFSCKSKCRGEEECECKYNKTLDEIENMDFDGREIWEIFDIFGGSFGWGVFSEASEFIKKYRIK